MPKEKEPEKEEKLEPVEDEQPKGPVLEPDETEEPPKEEKADDEEEERLGASEEEEPEDDKEREAIRERRREERKHRKEREKRDRRELNFLRRRNEDLERRLSTTELRQDAAEEVSIDQRIGHVEAQIKTAESLHAKAVSKNDGDTATEALSIRDALRDNLNTLKTTKANLAKQAKAREQAGNGDEEVGIDPETQELAESWAERNPWFRFDLRNRDSKMAKALEDEIFEEGKFQPNSDEYWEELDKRIGEYMPHVARRRVEGDSEEESEGNGKTPAPRRNGGGGGPRFSTGGRQRVLKKNEVYIDKERKQALIELGVWDDPVLREKYLKAYKRYDDEAKTNR